MTDSIVGREFESILLDIGQRLRNSGRSTYRSLTDRYELAGALDMLREFSQSGDPGKLETGCDRLLSVFGNFDADLRRWGEANVARLRTVGYRMSRADREGLQDLDTLSMSPEVTTTRVHETRCDVLVLAALHEPELTEFIEHLSDRAEQSGSSALVGGAVVYTGSLERRTGDGSPLSVVALTQDRPGMVDAAALTILALKAFKPAFAAMTGVCAGRAAAGVGICDVISPREVFTYDTGKYAAGAFHAEPWSVTTNATVVRQVRRSGRRVLSDLQNEVLSRHLSDLDRPKLHDDVVASGSSVVDEAGMFEDIASRHRKLVGLEMESYGFLRATQMYSPSFPAMVAKGVMDIGENKVDSAKRRAAFWASAFLARFLASEFDALVPSLAPS
jgi:nucleoside phosphorylase